MVVPSRQILLIASVPVSPRAAVIRNNVINVARLSVDWKVAPEIPTVHTGNQPSSDLVCPIAVAGSKVNIFRVDTSVEQWVFTPRPVYTVKVPTVSNRVSQTISSQHTLVASPIPNETVERVPRRVLDLAIDTVALKICILLGSNAVRDLLEVRAVPTGGGIKDVFVGVEVVRCALVVALDDVDKDELGIFGLRWALVVLGVDVGGVAVV